ncbi:MAG: hypothetical protein ISS45_03570 [Candidatus Omnitrophica bacterium]|nr:hypothetical protein [Candidatus Omnitrophota bacterium]
MKRISKKRLIICILTVILVDVVIGCLLLTNPSFSRLAMWNIIESDKQDDFYWKPEDDPEYFHFEPNSDKLSIFRNEIFSLVNDESNELERAVKIARYVGNIATPPTAQLRGRHTPRLQWDSPQGLLKQMRAGRSGGHCFHYSILYSTYLSSIGMRSRLWALEGDDGLGRDSHSITEVYIGSLKKWILIDVTLGIYFTKENYPLSVLELRDELLEEEAEKILVHSVSERSCSPNIAFERYARLLKCVFLRTGNDFANKYDARIRYGAFSRFQRYLDKLPSVWRRGLNYLLGRRDFLMHYVDKFSGSLRMESIIARSLFYFFIFSLVSTGILLIILFLSFLKRYLQDSVNI